MSHEIREELKKLILEEMTKPIAPDNSFGRLPRMEALGGKSV